MILFHFPLSEMPTIRNHPLLINKIPFLQRHSHRVLVSQSSISSSSISIHLKDLSDSVFGIETSVLVDLLRSSSEFEIRNGILEYCYESGVGSASARIVKRAPTCTLDYTFNFGEPFLTLKMPEFRCLTNDPTVITFSRNLLVLVSSGYVSTRCVLEAQRVEGPESFEITVSGKELKMVEELGGDIVLCYYKDCLVVFKFEEDVSTAVVIKSL